METVTRKAIKNYVSMSHPFYLPEVVQETAELIRGWVAKGETSWDELGFTDEDLTRRVLACRK